MVLKFFYINNQLAQQVKLWRNEKGIVVMGIMDFLLKPNSLEL